MMIESPFRKPKRSRSKVNNKPKALGSTHELRTHFVLIIICFVFMLSLSQVLWAFPFGRESHPTTEVSNVAVTTSRYFPHMVFRHYGRWHNLAITIDKHHPVESFWIYLLTFDATQHNLFRHYADTRVDTSHTMINTRYDTPNTVSSCKHTLWKEQSTRVRKGTHTSTQVGYAVPKCASARLLIQ